MSVDSDQAFASDKFKHNNKGFKYFMGYQDGIVRPLDHYALFCLKWVGINTCTKWL